MTIRPICRPDLYAEMRSPSENKIMNVLINLCHSNSRMLQPVLEELPFLNETDLKGLEDAIVAVQSKKRKVAHYEERLDAVFAAPSSHEVLFDNLYVRILKVTVNSRTKENMHIHQYPSIMIVSTSAQLEYYDKDDKLKFTTSSNVTGIRISAMDPEEPHAVKNIDPSNRTYTAIRIEVKSQMTVRL